MQQISPTTDYQKSYLEALEEGQEETGNTQLAHPKPHQSFEEFVKEIKGQAEGKYLQEGWVAATDSG